MSVLAVPGLVPHEPRAAAAARTGSLLAHRTIYDERYAECRAFATAARAFGAAVRSVERGDITDIYDELDVAWRATRAAIAGTTQFGPMFVIERLANERGMRAVLRAEHRPTADGMISHAISAPAPTLTLAEELCATGLEWPSIMAVLACRGVARPGAPLSSTMLTTRAAPPTVLHEGAQTEAPFVHYYVPQRVQQGYAASLDGPLYSWLIAPVSRS